MGVTVLYGGQITPGHIGPLMTKELGYPQAGVKGTGSTVDQLLVGAGGIAVPQAMMGHGTCRPFVLNLRSYCAEELLKPVDGEIGANTVRCKQLVVPLSDSQHLLQFNADALIDGHGADFTAFSLDRQFTVAQGGFSGYGVQPEALMNAQPCVIREDGNGGVVFMTGLLTGQHEPAKFACTPGAIHAPETAALQFHGQFLDCPAVDTLLC